MQVKNIQTMEYIVEYLSSREMLDLSKGTWKSKYLPAMPTARECSTAVVYNENKIVVLGGYNRFYCHLSVVEMLYTVNNICISLPSMPTPRYGLATGLYW